MTKEEALKLSEPVIDKSAATRIATALGWEPKISLEEGLKKTYEWYCHNML